MASGGKHGKKTAVRLLAVGVSGTGKTVAALLLLKRLKTREVVVLNGSVDAYAAALPRCNVHEGEWNDDLFEMENVAFILDDFAVGSAREERLLRKLLTTTSRHNYCHVFVVCHALTNNGLSQFLRGFNTFILPATPIHDLLLRDLTKGVGGGRDEEIEAAFKKLCALHESTKDQHYLSLAYDSTGGVVVQSLDKNLCKVDGLDSVPHDAGSSAQAEQTVVDFDRRINDFCRGVLSKPAIAFLHYIVEMLGPSKLVDGDLAVCFGSEEGGEETKISLIDYVSEATSTKTSDIAKNTYELTGIFADMFHPLPETFIRNERVRSWLRQRKKKLHSVC